MIRFDEGDRRFNFRVVGVAIHDGAVLLHRAAHDSFWTLPGGRAEHGETAEETLKREIREELETDVDVVRLLWFVENFFEYDQRRYHEIALYFLMRLPDEALPRLSGAFERTEADVVFQFQWQPVQAGLLSQLPLLPAFLPSALGDLPTSVVHIVQGDSMPR